VVYLPRHIVEFLEDHEQPIVDRYSRKQVARPTEAFNKPIIGDSKNRKDS
jgi:hypothetical protein